MSDMPRWEREGRDWPNRTASRFVQAAGLRWHVQVAGPEGGEAGSQAPVLLLLHGTGAATHSWRDLLPLLATRFTIVAPDLPGHGFTQAPPVHLLSLPGMAQAVAGLLEALGLRPDLVAGHSAGAAILARLALDGRIAPRALVGLNAALLPLQGMPGHLFSPAAKLFARLPMVPWVFAWSAADRGVVERLLRDTGSALNPVGAELYARLVRRPGHVAAALAMMAHWDLAPLARELRRLPTPLVLVVGANDRTIPPADATRVAALVPGARVVTLPGLGHLAHEEQPGRVADLLTDLAGGR